VSGGRVLVNLCWMVPGDVGGSEEYTTRLLGAVAGGPGDGLEVTVAAMAGVAAAHPELASLQWKELPLTGRLRPLRLLAESSWLARESRRHDLVHHFGGRLPAVRGGPAVVTIHDIQPLDQPGNFSAVKRAYLARALPRSVSRARVVVTPSAWVAERIVERLGVDDAKVRVVPSTYSPSSPHRNLSDDGPQGLINREISEWSGETIIYPAVSHPHKDHTTLLAAFDLVRQRRPRARLVLTGGPGRVHAEVQALVAATPGATHLGRVGGDDLMALIDAAAVLAFPSRYEGFGLPVLEAMTMGTPVVVADATALPEVVGEGGVLVRPGDVAAWAEALLAVLDDGVDTSTVDAARRRVEFYSPANARTRLVDAWKAALGPP
jgi:glycosyltransferase involved in cell wall biosynthesis